MAAPFRPCAVSVDSSAQHSFILLIHGGFDGVNKVTFLQRQQREHRLPQKSVNGTCDARPPVDGIRQGITYNYL